MVATKRKNQIVTVSIETLTPDGKGQGPAQFVEETQEAAVSFTVPGDVVEARILRKKKGLYEGKLEKVLQPAKERITPRCIHFGSCGGCRWQMLPYEKQLRIKQQNVMEHFKGLLTENTVAHPIIKCPDPWRYRNKMEFSFSSNAKNQKFLGLVMEGSRGKVFNLTECHLVNLWFAECVDVVRKWWDASGLDAYHPNSDSGALRTLTVREGMRTGDRMIMLTVSGNPDYALKKHQLESFVKALSPKLEPTGARFSIFLRIQQAIKGVPTNFYEMHLHGSDFIQEKLHVEGETHTFNISPTAFFQPNTAQAETLYSRALELAQIPQGAVVYDLFCGTGSIGICIAKKAKMVVGLEISSEAALDARTNVAQNGLTNVTIISGAVRHTLKQIHEERRFPPPDVAMIDPPRPGLDPDAMKALLEVKPKKLLYIACNPKTQAENIQVLCKNGYCLTALQAIDQFPHTVHVENIAVLERT